MHPPPTIQQLPPTVLVGYSQIMSLMDNQTAALWRRFMLERHRVVGRLDQDYYSLQRYPAGYFERFEPQRSFEKWAGVAVAPDAAVPEGMKRLELQGGLYAVFHYQGKGNNPAVFSHIYQQWLPQSGYQLADRPHFERLGEAYNAQSPMAEEYIWIPIQACP